MEPVLRIENNDAVRIITLHRPHCMNAFDFEMGCALRDAVQQAHADVSVSALIIAGEGKNFCTGADVKRDLNIEKSVGCELLGILQEAFLPLRSGVKPSVAALSGHVAGAGLSLALACDFMVADSTVRLSAPFTGVGLAPDTGIAMTLTERVGIGIARDMLFLGSAKNAGEALALGLIDELCEPGQVRERAVAKGLALARRAPLAIAAARTLLALRHGDPERLLAEELLLQRFLRTTEDSKEAVKAFIEKRPPVFSGK